MRDIFKFTSFHIGVYVKYKPKNALTRFIIEGGPVQPNGHINKRKIKN